jgi:hypothetical protein
MEEGTSCFIIAQADAQKHQRASFSAEALTGFTTSFLQVFRYIHHYIASGQRMQAKGVTIANILLRREVITGEREQQGFDPFAGRRNGYGANNVEVDQTGGRVPVLRRTNIRAQLRLSVRGELPE